MSWTVKLSKGGYENTLRDATFAHDQSRARSVATAHARQGYTATLLWENVPVDVYPASIKKAAIRLSPKERQALAEAAGTRTGIGFGGIRAGHVHSLSTLQALARKGLLREHYPKNFEITREGQDAAEAHRKGR
jgi:predicted kinase